LVAASLATLGAALATLALATPAQAAEGDVKVSISGLASSVYAGRTETFTVRTENNTDNELTAVRRVIVIQLAGLDANQVDLSQRSALPPQKASAGSGQVQFTETIAYRLRPHDEKDDTKQASFTFRFDGSIPPGKAVVTVYAVKEGSVLGSASDSMDVRGAGGQHETPSAAPTTTLPPVTAPPPTVDADETPVSPVEIDQQSNILTNDSGIPTILYVVGAVLLLLGGGILWLLFRSPKPALTGGYPVVGYPDDGHPVRPPNLGYPAQPRGAPLNPTTVMPTVREDWTPAPGVDPWARGPGTDRT